jgi:hypothetical protein
VVVAPDATNRLVQELGLDDGAMLPDARILDGTFENGQDP